MEFRRVSLEEYADNLPDNLQNLGFSFLEECLQNGTAEYYVIDDKDEFFFYILKDKAVDLCVHEKSPSSLFDDEEKMWKIFDFLRDEGYQKIHIVLFKNRYVNRNNKAEIYGFEVLCTYDKFIEYIKYL